MSAKKRAVGTGYEQRQMADDGQFEEDETLNLTHA